ncbi:MAG: SdiA-regulated domain-containing protein [Proteobacteria bacterium]|nr:SdiA-regulated domain-containing protein [Pseudomonadota bacterium]
MHWNRLVVLLVFATSACAESTDQPAPDPVPKAGVFIESAEPFSTLVEANLKQWKLPGRLREISGLALTDDERLLAVTDEDAVVYEIDYQSGALIKSFALGQPTVRDDFEGITVNGATVYLISSTGRIYVTREGNDGERVRYQVYDTGIGKVCEVEGLTWSRRLETLIIACKEARSKALKNLVTVYAWSPHEDAPPRTLFALDEHALAAAYDEKKFNPSAIAIDATTDTYLLLASRQRAIARVSSDGRLIASARLATAIKHDQAEGLAVTSAGALIIADEGGKGKARLGVYEQHE